MNKSEIIKFREALTNNLWHASPDSALFQAAIDRLPNF